MYLLQVFVADLSEEAPAVEKLARMTVFVYDLHHQRSWGAVPAEEAAEEEYALQESQPKDMMPSYPWKTHSSTSLEGSRSKDTMFSSHEKTHSSTSILYSQY